MLGVQGGGEHAAIGEIMKNSASERGKRKSWEMHVFMLERNQLVRQRAHCSTIGVFGSLEDAMDGVRTSLHADLHTIYKCTGNGAMIPVAYKHPGSERWAVTETKEELSERVFNEALRVTNGHIGILAAASRLVRHFQMSPMDVADSVRVASEIADAQTPVPPPLPAALPTPDVREANLLDTKIDDVEGFRMASVRVQNCLQNAEIQYVGELVQMTSAALLKTKNFGRHSLQEITIVLKGLGLKLDTHVNWTKPR